MSRNPEKRTADFHRRNQLLLGLAKPKSLEETIRGMTTAELRALPTDKPDQVKRLVALELERRSKTAPWRLK